MSCPPADTLSRLLVDALAGAELARVEGHVEHCSDCQETLGRLARLADGPDTQFLSHWRRQSDESVLPSDADHFLHELSEARFPAVVHLTTDEETPAAEWDDWPHVDGYTIVGELGRGGMGVVYRARHLALDRPVALKMVLAGPVLSPQSRRRLQQEARSIGRLQHPNVVQVYDVGEQGGRPYLAMELVEGGTLARRLDGHPRRPRHAARLVETLARAVDYAHLNGVVHRDLKPANVLVADPAADPPIVKITDFGLAKDLAGTTPLTQPGALLGTPSYMAPEQARGRDEAVGPAADIYALGAILYELLTGRPPFRAATPLDTLVQVVHNEPVPVTRLQPSVPRDLATICLKCLEKEPGRRYLRAADLADDLRRFLANEAIVARPIGPLGRLRRWGRRNPALSGLLVATASLVGIALGAVVWHWQAAVDARSRADTLAVSEALAHRAAEHERDAAQEARHRAERAAVKLVLDRGVSLCERGETTDGLLWLARGLEQAAGTKANDLDFVLRANIAAWAGRSLMPRESPLQGSSVTSVTFTPDGRHLLTGRWGNKWANPGPGEAQLWDADRWQPVGPALQDPDPVVAAVCSPDGELILTASSTGAVRLWTKKVSDTFSASTLPKVGAMTSVAFSPDGRRFVTGGLNDDRRGEACLWDVATARPLDPRLPHPGRVNAVAFTPDGSTVVVGCGVTDEGGTVVGGEVRLWDATTGRSRGRPLAHADAVTAVAVSPDGRLILTGCADRVARLWDLETGRPVGTPRQHPFPIETAAFSPDGKTVFTGGGFRGAAGAQFGVLVWDAGTGKLLTGILDHPDAVHGVAVRPDGRLVATACRDGRIRVYEVGDLRPLLEHRQSVPLVKAVFSPDGKFLVTSGGRADRGQSQVWDLTPGASSFGRPPLDHPRPVTALAFDAPGRSFVTASLDGTIHARNVTTGEPVGRSIGGPEPLTGVVIANDGRTVAALGADGVVRVWDVATGQPCGPPLVHDEKVEAASFHPRGHVLATCCHDGSARIWTIASGRPLGPPLAHDDKEVTAVSFSPDGRLVLTGGRDGTIRVWEFDESLIAGDSADVQPVARLVGPPRALGATPWAIEFSPDGTRFLTVAGDHTRTWGQVQFWDTATASPLGPPLPQRVTVTAAAFHPRGQIVAAGGWDGDVRLWDVASGRPVGPPLYHAGAIRSVTFDREGRRLAVVGDDGTVRVWAVLGTVGGGPEQVRLWVESLTGKELDESGAVHPLRNPDACREALRRLGGPPARQHH
jgi:WD40 repeat protein